MVQVQTATHNPSLADFTYGATALSIVIALSVLAMSVGLIRSETAPDLRTLTATGASGATRRTITAATAAASAVSAQARHRDGRPGAWGWAGGGARSGPG